MIILRSSLLLLLLLLLYISSVPLPPQQLSLCNIALSRITAAASSNSNSSSSMINDSNEQDNPDTELIESNFIETSLYPWCMEDLGCRRLFFQEPRANITIFKILLGDYFNKSESTTKNFGVKSILCNSAITEDDTTDSLIKQMWLLQMKHVVSNKNFALSCDLNHQLIFDSVTLTYDCICLPDRICDDFLYPLTFYYISIIIFFVLIVFLFIGVGLRIVKTIKYTSLLITKIKMMKEGSSGAEKAKELEIQLKEAILYQIDTMM